MGRNSKTMYRDPTSNVLFARWYEGEKKIRLSLNTTDEIEALKRLPFVVSTKMSWNQYCKSMQDMNTLIVNGIAGHQLIPGLKVPAQQNALQEMISAAAPTGQAFIDKRGYWILKNLGNGLPTDSTVISAPPEPDNSGSLFMGIDALRSAIILDNWQDIQEFYRVSMLNSYRDKERAARFGEIWLMFLEKHGVKSWNQITEKLVNEFKAWRRITPMPRGTGKAVAGKPPSNAIINQHIKYLIKSFNKAVSQHKMTINPVFEMIPDVHEKKKQDVLTFDEFKKVLSSLRGSVLQIVLLLFCSCKRRKEIVFLQIEDVDYDNHYCHYTEWKNQAKEGLRKEKAFHLTPAVETFLRRIIGKRKTGRVWPDITPGYVSSKYDNAIEKNAPGKNTTLKNIRQLCNQVMTDAGLTPEEKDFTLHNTVSERFYENQEPQAVYKRLAERTKKGIGVLSKAAEKYLR